jgi:hypothetical protein
VARRKKVAVLDTSACDRIMRMPPDRAGAYTDKLSEDFVVGITDSTVADARVKRLAHRYRDLSDEEIEQLFEDFLAIHDTAETERRAQVTGPGEAALSPADRRVLATARGHTDGRQHVIITADVELWRGIPGIRVVPLDDPDPPEGGHDAGDSDDEPPPTAPPHDGPTTPPTGPALVLIDGGLARRGAAA